MPKPLFAKDGRKFVAALVSSDGFKFRRRVFMAKFIFGLIVGIIAVPAIVYLYFSTGMAPIATAAPPMPFSMAS